MMLRKFKYSCAAAVSLLGLAFGAAPAAAGGCGYYGCRAAAAVVVVQPYIYQSCSCCGCSVSGYYYAYAPAYVYRPSYYGYVDGYYRPRPYRARWLYR